ncbi:MAG TPA: imidazole glycerol phosphate synthase subunit HisH [Verrucomicrobiae bacterium]|nr:imidazole glycerol phosphate synthase subunit HisH [Verrucomicrobiae bacterium]
MALVDYGMGNRTSISAALTRAGADVILTGEPEEIIAADGLVLPGVGAFPAAMERLEDRGLVKPLNAFRALGKPILGICLGHQLPFESSQESPAAEGLGWIQGKVVPIRTAISPNIGWRLVRLSNQPVALTRGLGLQALFYHAHEFAAQPTNAGTILGVTELARGADNRPNYAVAITQHENVYGTQFHPEKSSYAGLRLLKNFVDLCS